MSIASINIQTAKATSKAHMSRDKNHKITYLLDPDSNGNEYKSFLDSEKYLEAAKVAAKKITGRKMQQKAIDNFIQEAVLNLENFHTVADVEKVFLEFKKEFGGFQIFDIAIHRDEGYFYNFKEDLEYRPNRDIFFNESDKKFYLDSKFKNEVDLNQFEKRYNYHAHVLFSKFNMTTGKNPRLKKSDMSKIQTISAQALGMQRGELFSKAKRMSHWQLKKSHDLKRDEKQKQQKKTLAKQKDLKAENAKLQAQLQELGAERADHAKREQVNKELKERIKQKDLTIEELKNRLAEHLSDFKREDKDFIAIRTGNPSKSKIDTSLRIKKNIIASSFQEKVFFKHYQHSVRENLKGFYIDTSRSDGKVILSHKDKKIKIIDTGEKIISYSEDTELQSQVKIMLDIAQAKEWNLLMLNIGGEENFKKEVTKQVLELLRKNKPLEKIKAEEPPKKDDSDFRAVRTR